MTLVSMPYSSVGTMHSTTQMTVTQNGFAPGKENGASVATSAASGSETNETFRRCSTRRKYRARAPSPAWCNSLLRVLPPRQQRYRVRSRLPPHCYAKGFGGGRLTLPACSGQDPLLAPQKYAGVTCGAWSHGPRGGPGSARARQAGHLRSVRRALPPLRHRAVAGRRSPTTAAYGPGARAGCRQRR